ncbi:MAG: ABC transporter ATP-binding protein [FCB group bacterium]|nr:ABC transporter ATP-binding protein [FCB group bacterium]
MIKIRNLSKQFGDVNALKKMNLSVQPGEFFGLLGPNGAGKTTTVNILSTLLKPDEGSVTINGLDLLSDPRGAKRLLGVVPQELALYDQLSAADNLHFWAELYGMKGVKLKTRIRQLLELMGLADRQNDRLATFSGGMKRRVNLAVALLHDPDILFLDEPTVGIDVQSRHRIYEILGELHREGKTIVYTTHYLEEVERLCEKIAIIDHGEIKAEGTLESLRQLVQGESEVLVVLDDSSIQTATVEPLPADVRLMDEGLLATGDDVNDLVQKLVTICSARNWKIRDIELKTASLETVFLQLTGKELRD